MTMTKIEFNRLMKYLKGVYTYANFCGDKETMDIWFSTLASKQYPVEHIERAIKAWVEDNPKPPTPADIIEYVQKLNAGELKKEVKWQSWILIDRASGEVIEEVCERDKMTCDDIATWFRERGHELYGKIIKPMSEAEYKYGRREDG